MAIGCLGFGMVSFVLDRLWSSLKIKRPLVASGPAISNLIQLKDDSAPSAARPYKDNNTWPWPCSRRKPGWRTNNAFKASNSRRAEGACQQGPRARMVGAHIYSCHAASQAVGFMGSPSEHTVRGDIASHVCER